MGAPVKTFELIYDAVGPVRSSAVLPLAEGATVADALRAVRSEGYEIGFMQVWLNLEPLNNAEEDLKRVVPDKSVLHIRMVEKWEI